MMRSSVLILLVLFCLYTQGQHLEEDVQRKYENYVIPKDPMKMITAMPSIDNNGNHNKVADYVSYKSTQQPNRPKPTKKPGTYLQSIWDIYFP